MWDVLTKEAISSGLFALLFVTLLWWVMRKNDEREIRYIQREDKYLEIIDSMNKETNKRLTRIEERLGVDEEDGRGTNPPPPLRRT